LYDDSLDYHLLRKDYMKKDIDKFKGFEVPESISSQLKKDL